MATLSAMWPCFYKALLYSLRIFFYSCVIKYIARNFVGYNFMYMYTFTCTCTCTFCVCTCTCTCHMCHCLKFHFYLQALYEVPVYAQSINNLALCCKLGACKGIHTLSNHCSQSPSIPDTMGGTQQNCPHHIQRCPYFRMPTLLQHNASFGLSIVLEPSYNYYSTFALFIQLEWHGEWGDYLTGGIIQLYVALRCKSRCLHHANQGVGSGSDKSRSGRFNVHQFYQYTWSIPVGGVCQWVEYISGWSMPVGGVYQWVHAPLVVAYGKIQCIGSMVR